VRVGRGVCVAGTGLDVGMLVGGSRLGDGTTVGEGVRVTGNGISLGDEGRIEHLTSQTEKTTSA